MSVPRPSEKPVRSETGMREEPADLISSTKWHHQSPLVTRIPLKGQLYQLTVKNNFSLQDVVAIATRLWACPLQPRPSHCLGDECSSTCRDLHVKHNESAGA